MIQSMVKKKTKQETAFSFRRTRTKEATTPNYWFSPSCPVVHHPAQIQTQRSVPPGAAGVGNPMSQCKPKPVKWNEATGWQSGSSDLAHGWWPHGDGSEAKGTRLRSHWSSFPRGSIPRFLVTTCRTTAFSFLTWLACWPETGCAGWSWWFLRWTSCSPRKPPLCSSPPLILWETLLVTYPQTWTLRSTWRWKSRICHVIWQLGCGPQEKSHQKGLGLNFPSSCPKLHQTLERTASAWIGNIAASLTEGVCNIYVLAKTTLLVTKNSWCLWLIYTAP